MRTEEFRKHLPLSIKEIRTSHDGCIDFTFNCWSAGSVILVADRLILEIRSVDEDHVIVTALSEFNKEEYPYVVKATADLPMTITEIEPCSTNDEQYEQITGRYENCYIWIMANSFDDVLLSLQEGEESSKLPLDPYGRMPRWIFTDERISRRALLMESLQKFEKVWKVRKIYEKNTYRERSTAIVVTLNKTEQPFEERIKQLYRYISERLSGSKQLETAEHCNVIRGFGYSIMIYIEGYRKHAHVRGWWTGKTAEVELLHRIATEVAVREFVLLRRRAGNTYMITRYALQPVLVDAESQVYEEKYPDLSDRVAAVILARCRKYRKEIQERR